MEKSMLVQRERELQVVVKGKEEIETNINAI